MLDYHIHSAYSDDSEYPMEQVVRDAVKKGISELCFTDHVDYGVKRDWDDPRGIIYRPGDEGEPELMPNTNVDYPRYVEELLSLREKYSDSIKIKLGLEFGMQTHTIAEYESLFSRYPFDFIIMSIHQVDDKELWLQDYQRGKSWREYNEGFYMETLKVIQRYKNYSVIGHMDSIVRYDNNGVYPFEGLKPIISEILRLLIRDGKGIELNTSCVRYGLSDLTPSRDILRLYRSMGGEIITIGSDSHKPSHLGEGIYEGLLELKALGYKNIYSFDRMRPIAHPIDELIQNAVGRASVISK